MSWYEIVVQGDDTTWEALLADQEERSGERVVRGSEVPLRRTPGERLPGLPPAGPLHLVFVPGGLARALVAALAGAGARGGLRLARLSEVTGGHFAFSVEAFASRSSSRSGGSSPCRRPASRCVPPGKKKRRGVVRETALPAWWSSPPRCIAEPIGPGGRSPARSPRCSRRIGRVVLAAVCLRREDRARGPAARRRRLRAAPELDRRGGTMSDKPREPSGKAAGQPGRCRGRGWRQAAGSLWSFPAQR